MSAPPPAVIKAAVAAAMNSTCRSRRGVVVYGRPCATYGVGFNGPPLGGCPGRAVCAGNCGQRSVHAEIRALRQCHAAPGAPLGDATPGTPIRGLELVHVELASDSSIVACGGPSCLACAKEIADVGFIAGVWLYEQLGYEDYADHERQFSAMAGLARSLPDPPFGIWRRYDAEEFYRVSLKRAGLGPAA